MVVGYIFVNVWIMIIIEFIVKVKRRKVVRSLGVFSVLLVIMEFYICKEWVKINYLLLGVEY